MRHNFSVLFHLKPFMLQTKGAHQSTIFQTFQCSNDTSPNSSCHVWNQKIRVYSNFASLFSIKKNKCSVFFQPACHILWTKRTNQSKIFRLLSGWVKIHQIFHVIFETTSHLFLKLCTTLHCHERQLLCTFLAETLNDLDKGFHLS